MGKVWVDGVTGRQQEIDGRLKDKLKGFRVQKETLAAVFDWISKQQLNVIASVRLVMPKVEVDGFTEPRRESDVS